jgi:hypothetical protein
VGKIEVLGELIIKNKWNKRYHKDK